MFVTGRLVVLVLCDVVPVLPLMKDVAEMAGGTPLPTLSEVALTRTLEMVMVNFCDAARAGITIPPKFRVEPETVADS